MAIESLIILSYEDISEEIEEDIYKFTSTMKKVENAIITLFDQKGSFRLGSCNASI